MRAMKKQMIQKLAQILLTKGQIDLSKPKIGQYIIIDNAVLIFSKRGKKLVAEEWDPFEDWNVAGPLITYYHISVQEVVNDSNEYVTQASIGGAWPTLHHKALYAAMETLYHKMMNSPNIIRNYT